MTTLQPAVQAFFDAATATWTYVVYAQGHPDRRCAIIDSVLDYDAATGETRTQSADALIAFIEANGLQVQWLLETHIHADHLTAAAYLKQRLGGQIAISRQVLQVLENWASALGNEATALSSGLQFDHLFADEENFSIGPLPVKIIPTPGHTPTDISYLIGDAVFVGDAMFLPDVGTGRCDFPGGSAAASFASTRKLLELPESNRMYVGHDYPPNNSRAPQCMTSVAEQKRANVRVREEITEAQYVLGRNQDDQDKPPPKLLQPAIKANLRAGHVAPAMEVTAPAQPIARQA